MIKHIVVCPCCGQQLNIKVSEDGQILAVLLDMPKDSEEVKKLVEEAGYCFGALEGGEKEIGP